MPDAPPRVQVERVAAGKPWWRSRTVWFNAGTAGLLLLDAAASHLGLLQPLLPPAAYHPLALVLTVGNVWLRALTTRGLILRPPAPGQP